MKPADLQPGHRIAHTVPGMTGTITVDTEPYDDTEIAARDGCPELGRVYVDVEVSDRSSRWDPDDLPACTGAEAFEFLTMVEALRYRLVYLPDTDVEVEQ